MSQVLADALEKTGQNGLAEDIRINKCQEKLVYQVSKQSGQQAELQTVIISDNQGSYKIYVVCKPSQDIKPLTFAS